MVLTKYAQGNSSPPSHFCLRKIMKTANQSSTLSTLEGWGYVNSDMHGYLGGLSILQEYYPERHAKVFLVHAPYIFMAVWEIVYPFIDKNTRKKIVFVDNSKLKSTLLEEIDRSQIPDIYGKQNEAIMGVDAAHGIGLHPRPGCAIRLALKKCSSIILLSQQPFLATLDPCLLLKSFVNHSSLRVPFIGCQKMGAQVFMLQELEKQMLETLDSMKQVKEKIKVILDKNFVVRSSLKRR
uniref:CRAL-TRIO domain-containing protein n=1 Tax=Salix viminalis TaxID=40686 RepID=A0A6N2NLP6_SALVM